MNWYKKNNYNYDLLYYKYSFNWGKFLLPIMIPLVPMLVYLGISPQEANNIAKKNNNNVVAIKKELQEKAEKKDIQENTTSIKKQTPIETKKPEETFNTSGEYKEFADNLIPYEGKRLEVYNDGIGKPTIGIGHLITPESRSIFNKVLGISNQEYNDIINKKRKLTVDQMYKLFYEYDLKEHINRAKSRLPEFDTYPKYIQVALVNAVYRGDLGKNTASLINSGNWAAAANEYIRHPQYNSPKKGLKGVTPRMNKNRQAMIQYAKELGQI